MNEKSATARGLIHDVRRRFEDAGLADADQDSRILVMELLALSHTDLVLRGDRAVSDENFSRVEQAVLRRLAREPVYRILGSREFYGLERLWRDCPAIDLELAHPETAEHAEDAAVTTA